MREVRLDLGIFLEDDVADYVFSLKSKGSLDSLIAEFLSKSFNGGYVVTQEQIDTIVDELFDDEDEDSRFLTESDTTAIGEVVGDILKRLLQEGQLSSAIVANSSGASMSQATIVEEEKPVTNIVTFTGAAESVSVGGDDSEEMSGDDADDLAAMFGF